MIRRLAQLVVCALLVGAAGLATADDTPPPEKTEETPPAPPAPPAQPAQPTTLGGKITDVTGKPVSNARVYIMPRGGARLETKTDKDGRYAIPLAEHGAYSVVIAVDQIHTYRQVLVAEKALTTLDVEVETVQGGEVITIIDRPLPRPEVMPVPHNENVTKSLPYSKEAVERDAWARAFILLDIDEKGEVSRIKLLKRPGFGLDQIAIDEAFKLKFDAALDKDGKPMRTYIVWNMEWPSWGWLVQGGGTAAGRPVDYDGMYRYGRSTSATKAAREGGPSRINPLANANWAMPLPIHAPVSLNNVPCAGAGPLNLDLRNRAYRDCSTPDMSMVPALPWITREKAKTALAEIDAHAPQRVLWKPRSPTPHRIAGAVTAVSGAALIFSFLQYDKYSDKVGFAFTADANRGNNKDAGEMARWRTAMFASAGAFVISGAVTAFLWSRGQTKEYFSVQPTKGGGALSFGTSF